MFGVPEFFSKSPEIAGDQPFLSKFCFFRKKPFFFIRGTAFFGCFEFYLHSKKTRKKKERICAEAFSGNLSRIAEGPNLFVKFLFLSRNHVFSFCFWVNPNKKRKIKEEGTKSSK